MRTLEDVIWDQMAQARDVKVRPVRSDSGTVTYEVSLAVTVDKESIGEKARQRGQRVVSLLRCVAAKGLRKYLSAEDNNPHEGNND
jgi:hypothetical protein